MTTNPTPLPPITDDPTSTDIAEAFRNWFHIVSRHATDSTTAHLGMTAMTDPENSMDLGTIARAHPDPEEFYRVVRPWFLRTASAILPEGYWSHHTPFAQGVFRTLRFALDGVHRNPVLTRHLSIVLTRHLAV